MKTVTIPTCANPFVVIVNGIEYTYPAGATVEVPDDVAAVIEQHDEAHSKHAPAPVVPPFALVPSSGGGGAETTKVINLSDYYVTDNGVTSSLNDLIINLFSAYGGIRIYPPCQEFWRDIKSGKVRVVLDAARLESGMELEAELDNYTKHNGDIIATECSFLVLMGGAIRATVMIGQVTNGTRIVVAAEQLTVPEQ